MTVAPAQRAQRRSWRRTWHPGLAPRPARHAWPPSPATALKLNREYVPPPGRLTSMVAP